MMFTVCRGQQVYERAVANLPPGNDKRFWRRYIYLWIKYALFEELDAEEPDRAREVYRCAGPVLCLLLCYLVWQGQVGCVAGAGGVCCCELWSAFDRVMEVYRCVAPVLYLLS
jgi:hypothetical protein